MLFPSEKPVTRPSLELISPDRVFVPVLALFEDPNPCSTINQTVDDQGSASRSATNRLDDNLLCL
jgi:hypothetical protein